MLRREFVAGLGAAPSVAAGRGLRVAVFAADVTPPVGAALCYGLVPVAERVGDKLEARGVVLLPAGERPIVLCAVDWLGIGNESHDRWRAALAKAAGTVPERVAVQTVHQHDAPGDDLGAEGLLRGTGVRIGDGDFAGVALRRAAGAVRGAKAVRVTHVGVGTARVEGIASNRRILSPEGKVIFGRMTSCRNSPYCEEPVGVVDDVLRSLSFFDEDRRVATLSYFATHPMSYYGKGEVSADFVGMARRGQRDTFAVHFTGAAGNIGAGKFNDGSVGMRAVLADRLGRAMGEARGKEEKFAVDGVGWESVEVGLPLREGAGFGEDEMRAAIGDTKLEARLRGNNARYLSWYLRAKAGRKITVQGLRVGPARVVYGPGEMFVEYQLAAQAKRRGETVAMAAYGDYGPMYIGTARAYAEGGYETSAVSRVGPGAEDVLMGAVRKLLG